MEIFSEEEVEINTKQVLDFDKNNISIKENKEIKEENVAYFIARLAVNANNIYYSTVSVEYPSTSSQNDKGPSGFATVYNVQYSLGSGGQTKVKCPFFDNIIVTKDQRKCQGVTICSHIDDQIKSVKHCSVDFDSEVFKTIKSGLSNRSIYTNTLACFGTELLPEIHTSLNNLDHLHYLVSRVQHSIYLYEQGILGLIYAFSSNLNNIQEYIQRI
ncbi:9233_t:CDS:2, partial [Gigaspora margarita]